jgi:drug/metabolite transporter (DMT)-like permease
MKNNDNTFFYKRVALLPNSSKGLYWAALGVLGFSFSLPATRLAAPEMGAIMVGLGRAVLASVFAGLLLWKTKAPIPSRSQILSLIVVAIGVVFGFPLLSALALREVPASHAAIPVGLAPVLTALISVLRNKERLPLSFWAASLSGASLVAGYGLFHSDSSFAQMDLLLALGTILVAIGYAEGARLAVTMGGLRVVSWALVLASPLCLSCVIVHISQSGITWPSAPALAGFLYVSCISMFLAFIAWYKGLALAGVPRASQLQLLQSPLSLLWSGLFLGEEVSATLLLVCLGALACAFFAQRVRLSRPVSKSEDTYAMPTMRRKPS